MPRTWLLGLITLLGMAFGAPETGERVDLERLAGANGGQFVVTGDHGTLRLPEALAVVFENSKDVIVNGVDVALPAPILRRGDRWLAPPELLEVLKLPALPSDEPSAALPAWALGWEELELGAGVKGLHLFLKSEPDASERASLLMLDFAALARADKALEPTVKKFLAEWTKVHPGRALYYSVVADAGTPLPDTIEFVQNAQRYTVEADAGLRTLEGKFPGEGIGVVNLPPSFNPKAPMRVTWGSSVADYVFLP